MLFKTLMKMLNLKVQRDTWQVGIHICADTLESNLVAPRTI